MVKRGKQEKRSRNLGRNEMTGTEVSDSEI